MLMIPGPVPVEQDVRNAMSLPLVPHYGREWTALYRETLSMLGHIFETVSSHLFLLVGSGSAGLDAAVGTAAAAVGRVLVLRNGFFGERLEEITRAHSERVEALSAPWGEPISPDKVEDAIRGCSAELVVMTHCETSTGMLHPVREIAEVCHRQGALLLVDAVSSLGIEPLSMDAWGIDLCVSASQKGLGAPPGLAMVAVGEAAWDRIAFGEPRGWYLNLKIWDRYETAWSEWHPHPVTHAVSNVKALNIALQRLLHEGSANRQRRHREVSSALRRGLESLGFELLVPEAFASHGVTAARPPYADVALLLDQLRERFGVQLAGGIGPLRGEILRIGHMGKMATRETVESLLERLDATLRALRGKRP